MSPSSTVRSMAFTTIAALLVVAGAASAEPPPMGALGCCCAVKGKTYSCAEKSQADCLAEQPGAPMYPKMENWKKAYDEGVKASEAQEAKPMRGGWIAGACEK